MRRRRRRWANYSQAGNPICVYFFFYCNLCMSYLCMRYLCMRYLCMRCLCMTCLCMTHLSERRRAGVSGRRRRCSNNKNPILTIWEKTHSCFFSFFFMRKRKAVLGNCQGPLGLSGARPSRLPGWTLLANLSLRPRVPPRVS